MWLSCAVLLLLTTAVSAEATLRDLLLQLQQSQDVSKYETASTRNEAAPEKLQFLRQLTRNVQENNGVRNKEEHSQDRALETIAAYLTTAKDDTPPQDAIIETEAPRCQKEERLANSLQQMILHLISEITRKDDMISSLTKLLAKTLAGEFAPKQKPEIPQTRPLPEPEYRQLDYAPPKYQQLVRPLNVQPFNPQAVAQNVDQMALLNLIKNYPLQKRSNATESGLPWLKANPNMLNLSKNNVENKPSPADILLANLKSSVPAAAVSSVLNGQHRQMAGLGLVNPKQVSRSSQPRFTLK